MYTHPATWFGVCHFFEKYHGVRWLWPGEDGIYCERKPTLSVGDIDEVKAPPVTMREVRSLWQGTWMLRNLPKDVLKEVHCDDTSAMVKDYQVWERRMRLGVGGVIKASHSDGWFIQKYAKDHPEYFAQQYDGTRNWPEIWPRENMKLCVSNPEVAQIQVARARELLAARSDTNVDNITFNIGFQDSDGWCWCDACKALDPPDQAKRMYPVVYREGDAWVHKSIEYPYLSDRYVTYWNRVAEALEKDFPDKLVGGMSYGAVGPAPLRTRVHPNIVVPYTGGSNLRQSNPIEGMQRGLDGWFKAGLRNFYWRPNLMYFDYFGLPFYYAEDGGRIVQYMVRNGAKGFDFDTWGNHFATDGVNVFVILRIMWDPEQDVEALVREYCDNAYGRCGGLAHQYLMRCKAIREEIKKAQGLPRRDQDWVGTLGRFFDEQAIQDLDRLAEQMQAASRQDADQFRRRVEVFLKGHAYTRLQAAVIRLNDKKNKTVEEYNRLISLVAEKEQFIENLGPTWAVCAPVIRWRTRFNKFGPSVGFLFYESLKGKRVSAALPERWAFYVDQSDSGEQKKLHTEEFDDSHLVTISIYDTWEPQGFDYNGIAWYRARFRAPRREPGKRYCLWLGAVDESCWIYLNGRKVGENIYDAEKNPDAWYTPTWADVTDHLRYDDENLVAVKVRDIAGAGGIYKGAFLLEEAAR